MAFVSQVTGGIDGAQRHHPRSVQRRQQADFGQSSSQCGDQVRWSGMGPEVRVPAIELHTDDSCEQEDRWLDETLYAVDTSQIGSGRRRSMEPRRFSNPGLANAEMSPTKEFLTFNTPVSRRDTFVLDVQPVTPAEAHVLAQESAGKCSGPEDSSPETPYFLRHDAKLVQQTCPPKQRVEGLFASMEPGEDDDSNLALRQRLMAVRRKSLQWASKTKSPLGRVVINDAIN